MLTVGGLFSGIGGIELGLERAGMRVLWHCEADEFCQHILSERWPGVPCYPDVRTLLGDPHGASADAHATQGASRAAAREPDSGSDVRMRVPYVDVLCGGFPCQDISLAGAGAGIAEGTRSGLWYEFARLIRDIRPRYVIVENVSALLARGLDIVLGDLAACGYDAEWDCIPASAVGAPHRRDRVWIVAYPSRDAEPRQPASAGTERQRTRPNGQPDRARGDSDAGAAPRLADTNGEAGSATGSAGEALPEPGEVERLGRCGSSVGDPWAVEPDVGRVAHGVPARVDRLRSLGNAVVPQIAEWIGQRIVSWETA